MNRNILPLIILNKALRNEQFERTFQIILNKFQLISVRNNTGYFIHHEICENRKEKRKLIIYKSYF